MADTPEVVEARGNFLAAFEAEAGRAKRSAQVGFSCLGNHLALLVAQVLPGNAYATGAFYHPATFAAANYGASPLEYATSPASAREGILSRVQLNPRRSLSYRLA